MGEELGPVPLCAVMLLEGAGWGTSEMGQRTGEGIWERGETPWRHGCKTGTTVGQENEGEKLMTVSGNNAFEKFHCTRRKWVVGWGRGVKRGVLCI